MNRTLAPLRRTRALAVGCNKGGDEPPTAEAVATYARIVEASYAESLDEAEALDTALAALVASPSEAALDDARHAWLASREPYVRTEVYRFDDGSIDDPDDGPEGLLDAWPLDENYIAYVEGDPAAGIVNCTGTIDADTLVLGIGSMKHGDRQHEAPPEDTGEPGWAGSTAGKVRERRARGPSRPVRAAVWFPAGSTHSSTPVARRCSRRVPDPVASRAACALLVFATSVLAAPALAAPEPSAQENRAEAVQAAEDAARLWQLLDYIAVDYAGAVSDGEIVDAAEYAEMQEFARLVLRESRRLEARQPPGQEWAKLSGPAEALARAVDQRVPATTVAALARDLAARVAAGFGLTLAPASAPRLEGAARLYQENCASCHGTSGEGDGPLAAGMDPPPIAFTDRERARNRSLSSYYATISRGVEGTTMPAFASLDPAERWALAFYVGGFAYPEELAPEGRRLWRGDRTLRAALPNMKALATLTPAELARRIGEERTAAVLAFLRRHPDAVTGDSAASLAVAHARLAEALQRYREGDRRGAERTALAAYLDGIEPVEPLLRARLPRLVPEIEQAMAAVRDAIRKDAGIEAVAAAVDRADEGIARIERALSTPRLADRWATATAAFTILLREGLEALLLVVAMLTFLAKAGRRELVSYVHGGWVAAIAAGFGTWLLATHLITISGATRELTEGLGGLLAAVVLVSVGVWMHGRTTTAGWQRYVAENLKRVLSTRSAWFLAGLSFVVVYREAFETILFYVALWSEGQRVAVAGGAAAGAAALIVTALLVMRFARRLPIRSFFVVSSWLIGVLAVVLAGKGVAALQEAGWLAGTPLAGVPRVDWIGLFPTRETLFAQIVTLLATFGAFAWQRRRAVTAESPDGKTT